MKIETKDIAGNVNGFLVPIWSVKEQAYFQPDQVYMTVVAPHSVKGPHLHMKRRGLFCCVKGNIKIVTRIEVTEVKSRLARVIYAEDMLGESHEYKTVCVWPGNPAAIFNDSDEPAYVLNMPSPAWSADDPDEHEVEGWDYKSA